MLSNTRDSISVTPWPSCRNSSLTFAVRRLLRHVALAKSLVILGGSLAPIVGIALNVGVDDAVALTDSVSGAVGAAY